MPIRTLQISLLIVAATWSPSAAAAPDKAAIFVKKTLGITAYKNALADLNGDGRPAIFIYATDSDFCGSGGCTFVILSPHGGGFNVVLRSTVTQLPIRLLATSTHGWKDVGVTVAGGGIMHGHMARLRFNGRRYPSNPTVQPAVPMKRTTGKVIIPE